MARTKTTCRREYKKSGQKTKDGRDFFYLFLNGKQYNTKPMTRRQLCPKGNGGKRPCRKVKRTCRTVTKAPFGTTTAKATAAKATAVKATTTPLGGIKKETPLEKIAVRREIGNWIESDVLPDVWIQKKKEPVAQKEEPLFHFQGPDKSTWSKMTSVITLLNNIN